MKKLLVAAALAVAACSYALPGGLLVVSKREVKADAAAGLSYLGSCASGYFYTGSAAAVGRAAPYRTLDRDAETKDYYVVWAPAFVKLEPAAFAPLGFAARLSADEILVGVIKGMGGAAAIRAIECRTELRLLRPVTRVKGWKAAAEPPPTEKDPIIEAATNTIKADEYAGYIRTLQEFRTRRTGTAGCERSCDYIRGFLSMQNLDASLFDFPYSLPIGAYYPKAGTSAFIADYFGLLIRSRNGGASWAAVPLADIGSPRCMSWIDSRTGFVVGYQGGIGITRDAGDTWDTYLWQGPDPRTYRAPYDCQFLDAQTGWVGGYERPVITSAPYTPGRGFLYKTADGGRTWSRQTLPVMFFPGTIVFYNERCGWLGNCNSNYEPTFKYTNNGGATWFNGVDPITGSVYKVDVAPVGEKEAWAAHDNGANGTLYHTTDALVWEEVAPGTAGVFGQVEFPDRLHGYAAGSKLIATADAGVTWHEVTSAPSFPIAFMSFADADHGIIADAEAKHVAVTADGGSHWNDVTDHTRLRAANAVGERKGCENPDEIVIIGGHYDSISDHAPGYCPGAEDNGSGVAVAMVAARAFRNTRFKRTVRFIGFAAEEGSGDGSISYAEECARQGEKIVAYLNADMVSYDEDAGARDDLSIACQDSLYYWLYEYLRGVGNHYGNGLTYDHCESSGSDHVSFWNAGYAALDAEEGTRGSGGTIYYPYYHTTQDTIDKIQPAFGTRFSRDFAAMLAHLAGVAGTFPDPPEPGSAVKPTPRAFAVYPNPYRVTSSVAGFHFVGLAAPATVKVYDLAGRRVASWAVGASAGDECTWRPAADGGNSLADGIYLYVVEGDNQREVGKLAVVR
jgi:photosystem II stability/assembly factor-like uncharacterized protein